LIRSPGPAIAEVGVEAACWPESSREAQGQYGIFEAEGEAR
jgi:hypothetical protein